MVKYLCSVIFWINLAVFIVTAALQVHAFKNSRRISWWIVHIIEIAMCVGSFALRVYYSGIGHMTDADISLVSSFVFGAAAFLTMGLEIFCEIRDRNKSD